MLLLLTIKLAITALVFATGLSATRDDLFWIWRHPPLLARSFLAMYILVPLVAIAMVLVFDLPRGTKIGLLFLSISAGAPLLPRKLIKLGGDACFCFQYRHRHVTGGNCNGSSLVGLVATFASSRH